VHSRRAADFRQAVAILKVSPANDRVPLGTVGTELGEKRTATTDSTCPGGIACSAPIALSRPWARPAWTSVWSISALRSAWTSSWCSASPLWRSQGGTQGGPFP